jgi:hypothetical protein
VHGVHGAPERGDRGREPAVEEDAHERRADGHGVQEERVDQEPRRAGEQVRAVPLRPPATTRARVPRPAPALPPRRGRRLRRQPAVVLLAGSDDPRRAVRGRGRGRRRRRRRGRGQARRELGWHGRSMAWMMDAATECE